MSIKSENIVYIYYYDGINQENVKTIINIISALVSREKPTCLYFIFASNGGSVDAGVVFYNFLRSLPVTVITHNIGVIDSIANVIFLAGKKRYAVPHSTFLLHGVSIHIQNLILYLPSINEMLDRIKQDHKKIANIVCENTTITEKEITELFLQGETKDVQFALSKNLIHAIKLPEIPRDARIISIHGNS